MTRCHSLANLAWSICCAFALVGAVSLSAVQARAAVVRQAQTEGSSSQTRTLVTSSEARFRPTAYRAHSTGLDLRANSRFSNGIWIGSLGVGPGVGASVTSYTTLTTGGC